MSTSPIPLPSASTMALAEALRTVPPGAVIEYNELSRIARAPVQSVARGWLASARKIVLREDQYVFGAVRGLGLKRLTDAEIAASSRAVLRHVNRTTRQGILKGRCVADASRLPPDAQWKFYTDLAILNTFHQISKGVSIRRIENVTRSQSGELAMQSVLGVMLAVNAPQEQRRPRPEN